MAGLTEESITTTRSKALAGGVGRGVVVVVGRGVVGRGVVGSGVGLGVVGLGVVGLGVVGSGVTATSI